MPTLILKRYRTSWLILTIVLTAVLGAAAQEHLTSSAVTAATVFSDRAQVTRTCSEALQPGEQVLIFDNLPEAVERTSLTVDGSGNCILREVKFRQQPMVGNADSLTLCLTAQKNRFEGLIAGADDKIKQKGNEKQFVENIALKVTEHGTAQQAAQPELDSEKWERMVAFYDHRIAAIDREIRETDRQKSTYNDSLNAVLIRINNLGRDTRATRNQAIVAVAMQESGRVTVRLSYIVYGPSWTPAYELRVKSEAKTLAMTYKGLLRQNTGEDWNDADITLSTAQPSLGGAQPELTPWHINFYVPQPVARPLIFQETRAMSNSFASAMEKRAAPASPPAMQTIAAAVESNAVNAVFAISGKTTIKSDNEEHTTVIMTKEFPASFRYSAVPKLSEHAYLKAKIKNETDYPLLAGQSSIFLDNAFIANSTIEQVMPGQEFWTFLGVDAAVKVERKLTNQFEEQGGMFSKKKKITFEYHLSLANNRKTEEEVVLFDQLPISGNEDIKVELIEPKWKENTEAFHINDQQILEWYYKIQPGAKFEMPLKFSVEYPEGKTVPGL